MAGKARRELEDAHRVEKAAKKGRTPAEVETVLRWFTGYSARQLASHGQKETNLETFLQEAPRLHPARHLIKGVICGGRVEDLEDPMMREVRYLDKLIEELARGKAMDKILRA